MHIKIQIQRYIHNLATTLSFKSTLLVTACRPPGQKLPSRNYLAWGSAGRGVILGIVTAVLIAASAASDTVEVVLRLAVVWRVQNSSSEVAAHRWSTIVVVAVCAGNGVGSNTIT